MAPKEQPAEDLQVVDADKRVNTDSVRPPPLLAEKIEVSSTKTDYMSGLTNKPSFREVKKLLRKIRDSKVAEEVEEAMTLMAMMVNTDENEKASVDSAVQKIILLDGVGNILMALKDWYVHSEGVPAVAIPLLLKVCVRSDEKIRMLVANIGLPTLVATGNAHKSNGSVVCGVIGILSVICEVNIDDIKEDIATDDCIDLCVHAMKTWSNEEFVQSCCCLYLSNIASEPANQMKLCEKKVGELILSALEKFRHMEDKTAYRRAFRAMALYISNE